MRSKIFSAHTIFSVFISHYANVTYTEMLKKKHDFTEMLKKFTKLFVRHICNIIYNLLDDNV